MPARLRRALRVPALLAVLLATVVAVLAGGPGPAPAEAAPAVACSATTPLGTATGWTEFVEGDGRRGSSESEGKVAYGGSLEAQWMTISMGNGAQSTPGSTTTLVVNGSGGSFNVQRGSAYVGVLRGGMNFNGGTGAKRLASSPLDVAAAFPDLRARSAAWGTTPATGTARTVDARNQAPYAGGDVLLLTGTEAALNVFSVTPAQLRGIVGIYIDVPVGATALIDVPGTGAMTVQGRVWYRDGSNWTQASDGTSARNARTLWNFPASTDVTLDTGGAFGGTVLAPNAKLTAADSVGHNLGQVVVKEFASNRETHLHLFAGCLPATDGTGGPPTTPVDPPAPPTPSVASVRISKTVDQPVVLPGATVAFTLTAANRGTAAAKDVVLSDLLPVGVDFQSADAGCALDGRTVRCTADTIAAGGTRSFVVRGTAAPLAPVSDPNDQVVPFDAQVAWSVAGGEHKTVAVACQDGTVADGSVRVADVDHGAGVQPDRSVLHVLSERITSQGTYEATLQNGGTGQAQGRLHVACLPQRTTNGHALIFGDPVTKTQVLNASTEPYPVTFDCGTGRTPIATSIEAPAGRARIVASIPDGTSRRTVKLRVDQDATTVTVGVRCMSNLTGVASASTTQLAWRVIQRPISLDPGQQLNDVTLACGGQEKGIVAGFDLAYGLLRVGDEPQIKSRKFSIDNPTNQTLGGTLYLLCLGDRTGDAQGVADVVNTVTGTSSTPQDASAALSASVGLRIQGATPPSGLPQVTIGAPPGPLLRTSLVPPIVVVRAPAALTVASSVARLKASTVSVRVACRSACRGTVELRTAKRLKVGTRTYAAKALLAKQAFRLAAGRTGTVGVRIPARVARALRATGVRSVRVAVRDRAGHRAARTLRLRR